MALLLHWELRGHMGESVDSHGASGADCAEAGADDSATGRYGAGGCGGGGCGGGLGAGKGLGRGAGAYVTQVRGTLTTR